MYKFMTEPSSQQHQQQGMKLTWRCRRSRAHQVLPLTLPLFSAATKVLLAVQIFLIIYNTEVEGSSSDNHESSDDVDSGSDSESSVGSVEPPRGSTDNLGWVSANF